MKIDQTIILKGISQKGKSIIGTWGNEWIVKNFIDKVGFSIERNWMFVETKERLEKTDD